MGREFAQFGIRIQYPEKWTVETEDTEDGWSVSIISPDTAFLMISSYSNDFAPEELADMALAAMRESYAELEAESVVETLAGLPAIGHDVEFVALDLFNTCWIRALAGLEGNLLLMSQCTDQELDGNGETMRSISASLQFQDDD
jgi:hypothetical protein